MSKSDVSLLGRPCIHESRRWGRVVVGDPRTAELPDEWQRGQKQRYGERGSSGPGAAGLPEEHVECEWRIEKLEQRADMALGEWRVPSADLAVVYSGAGEKWQVSVPAETLADLLRPFDGRRRVFLVALLNGYSKAMAAANAGVTPRCAQLWAKRDPEFGGAVAMAQHFGFASVVEPELYRRAFAGPKDRGSMRALELILKARDPSYREKQQVELDVIHRAEEATRRLIDGWDRGDTPIPEWG